MFLRAPPDAHRSTDDRSEPIINGWNRIAVGFGGFIDRADPKSAWAKAKAIV
jgi:hypothetical protein